MLHAAADGSLPDGRPVAESIAIEDPPEHTGTTPASSALPGTVMGLFPGGGGAGLDGLGGLGGTWPDSIRGT